MVSIRVRDLAAAVESSLVLNLAEKNIDQFKLQHLLELNAALEQPQVIKGSKGTRKEQASYQAFHSKEIGSE